MPRNYGRVGNEGFSYFSDKAFENLEKAIQKLEQYNKLQEKMTKANADQYEKMYITTKKYEKELKDMGIDINSNISALKRQYETEKEIYDQRKQDRMAEEKARLKKINDNIKAGIQQARDEELAQRKKQQTKTQQKEEEIKRKFERDLQLELSDLSEKEIKRQRDKNKYMDETLEKVKKMTVGSKEYNDEFSKTVNYLKQIQRTEARADRPMDIAGAIFGTTKQDVKDMENHNFLWKTITKTFAEAVNQFKNAVKSSITDNYNSTEKTLNSITASNRMSWSSGSFSFGGRSYNGYSKLNNAINDQLLQDGLFNNISNTEVMESVAKLTSSSGFGLAEALRKGYEDTVIKYIVPYLDTTSESFENLEMVMPRNVKECSSNSYNFTRTIWRKSVFK